jgi:hypothetical protein
LPVLAVDLSFKQKHPANNAAHGRFARISGVACKNPSEPHDVGSEYAVYMVGSPAKSAFWQAAGRAGREAPIS